MSIRILPISEDLNFEKSNNKNVCVYAYFEKNNQYKENLVFFLNNGGILDNVDYYIVVNGEDSIAFPQLDNVKIIRRKNSGFDFGAWQNVIKLYIKKKYDYYIFINSSVRGPYLTNGIWLDKFIELFHTGPNVKMVGTTINVLESREWNLEHIFKEPHTHIQSMFFILNNEGFEYLDHSKEFDDENILNDITDIHYIIINKEIKISQMILNNGWNINCIASKYRDIDYRMITQNFNFSGYDPNHYYTYFGSTITPEDVIFYKITRFN